MNKEESVGMYVRLGGKFTKLKAINECTGGTYYYFEDAIFGIIEAFGINYENNLSQDLYESFKKRLRYSFNIIDLIEVGDYVNGYKITEINLQEKYVQCDYPVEEGTTNHYRFYEEGIYTIVTKEQFKSVEYEV